MKKITFIRHAKSSWDYSNLGDIDRPLALKGITDAKIMGKLLNKEKIGIDKIISSPAKRAYDTAELIASEIKYPINQIDINHDIYNSNTYDIFSIIKNVDSNKVNHMILVGHNPTFHNLIEIISNYKFPKLPTCSIVTLILNINKYNEIKEGIGKVYKLRIPKDFR